MLRWTSPRCKSWTNWTNSFLAVMALCFIPGLRLGLCQSTAVSQATASGEYRVAGTVVSKSDGHPLDHALIVLVDVKNRANAQTTITKEDGRFSFEGLAGGKYSLGGERKGYIHA